MAETAMSFASQHVLPKFLEAVKMLKDLPKEVSEVTDELESFQDFIHDADKMAEVEEDKNRRERIKKRLMRLRKAAVCMEDVIDDYVICNEKQSEEDPRCAALLCEAAEFIKTQIFRLKIAYQIQDVKSHVRAERDGFENHFPIGSRSDVSRSYTIEELLRDMTNKLCKERREDPPRDVATMNQMSLIEEVRNRLCNKRYVVLFDDVWNETFWDDIELALIDNKNGSRPLSKAKSLELLCKKAFGYGFDGCCPKDYEAVGLDIVRKCECLPLAIVAIGSLLYRKCKSPSEWHLFSQNLSSELQSNSELHSVTKILSLSYDDLPQNLRSCLLYFGMYPEDYEVKCGRLIQHWIAEGFVKHENGRNLEEVAQQHLMELISRRLVLVASFTIDDRAKACRVHDSIHEMIRGKIKNTGFCEYIDEHNHLESSGIIRRLTIARNSNGLSGSIEESQHVRSILIFTDEVSSKDFTRRLLEKYMRLKVLDFEYAPLYDVPENLGSLIHLKYLSFRGTSITSLPKSINKLQNLETLDVRAFGGIEVPKEITKLRKLRCLLGDPISSVAVKDSLGSITSLEKMYVLIIDPDGVVIRELGKLKQLRDLRLSNLSGDHGDTLCSSINEMPLLERLHISLKYRTTEALDLHIRLSLSKLRKLHLCGRLKEFPNWIPQLQNLVKLSLVESRLTNIRLTDLGSMPNLLLLSFDSNSYDGETLHFENRGFQKLKELKLNGLQQLSSIFIDSGALQSLEKLQIMSILQLKAVPCGIQHLKKLQVLDILYMPTEFQQRIDPNGGKEHWMIKHVPDVHFVTKNRALILAEIAAEIFSSRL
ncbi:putative late blight resistance protein-like protein [Vigna angularis]|uniref:Putative late blight resistance protein-like protein n=1 Tax=Phaseolus angularis TaxID=3914 RepID=A0A8T0K927_PHAAN|nr:putative late blight resistance protein-like protein [Vigna angularis]